MRITQEQFDELDQLDRIEFRQVKKLIDDKYQGGTFMSMVWFSLMFTLFVVSFSILVGLIAPEYTSEMSQSVDNLYIIWLSVPLGIIFDLVSSILNKKATEKLENKYFKIDKVKRK